MNKSWIVPSLGGWLSIVNLLLLIALIILVRTFEKVPKILFAVALYCLTFPLAIFWMLPSLGGPTTSDIFIVPLVIIVNAFVWGYGLAKMIRFFRPLVK
jgi:hypothetical protein